MVISLEKDGIKKRQRGIDRYININIEEDELKELDKRYDKLGLDLGKWRALLKERGTINGQDAETVREGI